jgi:hypothetical protein
MIEQTVISDYLLRLDHLIERGRGLRGQLAADWSTPAPIANLRAWQQECGVIVNELSGGSKAHWLARAFSEAFLVRSVANQAVQEAPPADIVARIVGALEHARGSLATVVNDPTTPAPAAPRPHRFDFVHDPQLRPFLEQAFVDARAALGQGHFRESLITTCGVLEALITDALAFTGQNAHDWSFQARIDAAEHAGLIRGGCARLTPVARGYRDLLDADGNARAGVAVSARDARIASQVLQVVIRDLDPGR